MYLPWSDSIVADNAKGCENTNFFTRERMINVNTSEDCLFWALGDLLGWLLPIIITAGVTPFWFFPNAAYLKNDTYDSFFLALLGVWVFAMVLE
jgi:hypothetical protein